MYSRASSLLNRNSFLSRSGNNLQCYYRRTFLERKSPRKFIESDPEELRQPLAKHPKNSQNFYVEHPEVAALSSAAAESWRKEHQITIIGSDKCPNPILEFKQAPFPEGVVKYLTDNYSTPTTIQSQSWPIIFSGRDMVGSAKTGSGKTLAFILPALEHIRRIKPERNFPTALVLAPTRELVQQIEAEAATFFKFYDIQSTCFFGGQGNRSQQYRSIGERPQLIVAAPGRLLDFLGVGAVTLDQVQYLVLDEADRMLDMGFETQIREIVRRTRSPRQTLMFSATWPKGVQALCQDYITDPIRVNIGSLDLAANPDVNQKFIFCDAHEKFRLFLNLLQNQNPETKTLVFVQTIVGADFLATQLSQHSLHNKYRFATLHGNKAQSHRNNIMEDFKKNKLMMVIATDVASRGLDVKDIDLVVNYDMPQNIENYIHRIGRTARAGKKGTSLTFFTPNDQNIAKDLQAVLLKAGQEVPEEISHLESSRYGDYKNIHMGHQGTNKPMFNIKSPPKNDTFQRAKEYLENLRRSK